MCNIVVTVHLSINIDSAPSLLGLSVHGGNFDHLPNMLSVFALIVACLLFQSKP